MSPKFRGEVWAGNDIGIVAVGKVFKGCNGMSSPGKREGDDGALKASKH